MRNAIRFAWDIAGRVDRIWGRWRVLATATAAASALFFFVWSLVSERFDTQGIVALCLAVLFGTICITLLVGAFIHWLGARQHDALPQLTGKSARFVAQLVAYEGDESQGHGLLEIENYGPDDALDVSASWHDAMGGGGPFRTEKALFRVGEKIDFPFRALPAADGGYPYHSGWELWFSWKDIDDEHHRQLVYQPLTPHGYSWDRGKRRLKLSRQAEFKEWLERHRDDPDAFL